jgi:hypothetical protein
MICSIEVESDVETILTLGEDTEISVRNERGVLFKCSEVMGAFVCQRLLNTSHR